MARYLSQFSIFLFLFSFGFLWATDEPVDPAVVEEFEKRKQTVDQGNLKGLFSLANFAKSKKLYDEADEIYQSILKIDPFYARAHKALNHVKLFDVWMTKEERKEFKEKLKEEKKDPEYKQISRLLLSSDFNEALNALDQLRSDKEALSIDWAYRLITKAKSLELRLTAMEMFYEWSEQRARDYWIACYKKNQKHVEILRLCVDYLSENLTKRKDDPVTKLFLKEVSRNRKKTITLKMLSALEEIPTEEVKSYLRAYLQTVKDKDVRDKYKTILEK